MNRQLPRITDKNKKSSVRRDVPDAASPVRISAKELFNKIIIAKRREEVKKGGFVMRRIKKRTFCGAVCEQEVFSISERTDIKKAEYRPRFETDEEREQHKIGISRRKHVRAFNANFSPSSLYSTLTFDDENEVHTFDDAKHVRDLYIRRLKYAFPDAVIFAYLDAFSKT